jgi:hypothetical protein
MATSNPSPRSSLRNSLREIYRGRGHRNNNIWLVYSVKTDADWYIPSDRQLIHWLYFLEANSEILKFDLAPDPILSHDLNEAKATELDAIAIRRDGGLEWHEVKAGKRKSDSEHKSQQVAQLLAATDAHATYRRFNDDDLKPKVRVGLRWHKAIGFAAAIRGQEHNSCRNELVLAMRDAQSGKLYQLLDRLAGHDPAIVLGVFVRLAIKENLISMDLDKGTFGLQTNWIFHG